MNKTLIGKENWLFLQNDSCRELEIHNDDYCNVSLNFYKKYEKYKEKTILVVFPNKSLIYKQYLPDGYDLKYRKPFDIYAKYFDTHIIDGYNLLKDEENIFYKTDTHINNKGSLVIYYHFIDKINELFALNITKQVYELKKIECESLVEMNLAIGDLTWSFNLGDQSLSCIRDTFYEIVDNPQLYIKYIFNDNKDIVLFNYDDNILIDETMLYINKILDWHILSKYILFKNNNKNTENKTVVFFYDSFLCSSMHLYINLFTNVYFVKSIFNPKIIDLINPDYVFEFRCERFLF